MVYYGSSANSVNLAVSTEHLGEVVVMVAIMKVLVATLDNANQITFAFVLAAAIANHTGDIEGLAVLGNLFAHFILEKSNAPSNVSLEVFPHTINIVVKMLLRHISGLNSVVNRHAEKSVEMRSSATGGPRVGMDRAVLGAHIYEITIIVLVTTEVLERDQIEVILGFSFGAFFVAVAADELEEIAGDKLFFCHVYCCFVVYNTNIQKKFKLSVKMKIIF